MMKSTLSLPEPRIENGRSTLIAGFNGSFTEETRGDITALWYRFAPHIGHVAHQTGTSAYGVCWKFEKDCGFEYLAGVEVVQKDGLPAEFTIIELAPQRYAIFTHHGHYSKLPETFQAIWQQWLPQSGEQAAEAPVFERYTEEFNPQTGEGGTEVWVPLQN